MVGMEVITGNDARGGIVDLCLQIGDGPGKAITRIQLCDALENALEPSAEDCIVGQDLGNEGQVAQVLAKSDIAATMALCVRFAGPQGAKVLSNVKDFRNGLGRWSVK
jgi:hypothetical protein